MIKEATEKEEDSNTYRFSRSYYLGKKSSRNDNSRNNTHINSTIKNTGINVGSSKISNITAPNKTTKPNYKIKSSQPLSPRSTSSGNKKSGRNKVPKLKINSPANLAGFTETSNKASIPDDEEAFFIKSSRECQAKQPYTATYN